MSLRAFTPAWLFLFFTCLSAGRSEDQCSAGEGKCADVTDCSSPITGFSIFTSRSNDAAAFIQDLRPMISVSRARPGNCGYHMYTDPKKPGVIGFIELWADPNALGAHLKGEAVTSTFTHQYYKELASERPLLAGPWFEVPEKAGEDEEIEMVFYWTMDCSKKHVWDIITNWEDASWVKGDPKTTIVPLDDDGKPMSDEEAAKVGYVDPEGGLGPVVQRRTWANGLYVDVRMLTKTEETFTTVQQTLSALVFPKVVFDKFYVTLSLDSEGLDPDTQSRMRYHTRATLKTGTFDDARETLKSDFYGPRIEFYQEYFNCSKGIQLKRVESTIETLHKALSKSKKEKNIAKLFDEGKGASDYLKKTIGGDGDDSSIAVEVKLPIQIFGTPDLRVVAVEDIVTTSLSGTTLKPRIVIYQLNPWGRIVSTRIFDQIASESDRKAKKLINATEKYYKSLETGDIEKVRKLYSKNPILEDPVSFVPPRTFDSVYTNFYKLAKSFEYKRYPLRTFVDSENHQMAQVVDALFELASGDDLKANPVQVFTFNKHKKITKFEAFFVPTTINFSELE